MTPRPPDAWVRVTLRVFADTLDAKDLARRFEALPTTKSVERLPGRDAISRTTWLREMAGNSAGSVAELLDVQLTFLERHRDTIAALPADAHVDLYLGLYASKRTTFSLPGPLVARLAAAAVPVVLDLYPPGSEELDEATPLEAPDRNSARAAWLSGGRRVIESGHPEEAPVDVHLEAVLDGAARKSLSGKDSRLVVSFASSSGHGVSVLMPEVLAKWGSSPPEFGVELLRPLPREPFVVRYAR